MRPSLFARLFWSDDMLRMCIFGLAIVGNLTPVAADSLSPWFGGESQESFQVAVTEAATQVSDITNSTRPIAAEANSTACLPEGCPTGANTAKTIGQISKASQF
jgi:hypothetical protein